MEIPPFDFANHVNLASFADVATAATMNDDNDDGGTSTTTTVIHPSLKDHLRYEHLLVQRYVATLLLLSL
jgi:hypothetical protein